MSDDMQLPVIYYNWDKGLEKTREGVYIYLDDTNCILVKDVKFYDTIRGFIQSATAFYMPMELKGNNTTDAN